ncbi:MAG: ATP-binding cassette domain-containing protein [Bdellovibrionales bacterium]|nr:ATP-binding cassette domain-containing protein [Bdellovibrionales bacterium]
MRALLQVKNLQKAYGAKVLLSDETFAVNEGERVGVIGPNGAGKTTFFKILIGQEESDSGEVVRANGMRLGYLAQEDRWEPGETPESYLTRHCITPIWDLKALGKRLGLDEGRMSAPIESLSGGYRMRVKLLRMIGTEPDLMLLDEPTNYLDLETVLVLEQFLLETRAAFLLISHDREFLRRVTDHILEIEGGDATKYPGSLDDYFEQKALVREQLEKTAASQAAKRRDVLDFVARFGAKATKARQAQSRMKQLEKMETVELKALPVTARIRLPAPTPTGKRVLALENATLGYAGGPDVLRGVNAVIQRGERWGVVGFNGAGKSTLLKTLSGQIGAPLELRSGARELGHQVSVAYFAQHVSEALSPDDTVIAAMGRGVHPSVIPQDVLDLAGSLGFSGDTVRKPVRVLSGGEKSRVALGRVLLQRAPCLILDEPTNHLDFDTVEALTQALSTFEGTVILVSHDRAFVSRVATKILEVRDGRVSTYPGTYEEYVWSLRNGSRTENVDRSSDGPSAAGRSAPRASGTPAQETRFNFKEAKKELQRQVRAVEKECAKLEAEVDRASREIDTLNEKLPTVSGPEAGATARALGEAQGRAQKAEAQWFELLEQKAALDGQIAALGSDS